MAESFGELVARYGELLVAVLLFVEAIGIPVPGETALVTAAALAGRGTMSIAGVVIAACLGTISGGATGYWIGLRGGPAIIARYGKALHISPDKLAKAHAFFGRHGGETVLVGRFVAFVRSYVCIFAGISAMPARRFLVYNAVGGAAWAFSFSALGYLFGRNLPRLIRYIGRVSLIFAILIAVVVIVVFLWRWYVANRATLFARRIAQREYLVVHLAIGFTISLSLIVLFGSITEAVLEDSPLTRFDVIVATRLHESAHAGVLQFFSIISAFGSRAAMTLLLIAGSLLLVVRRRGLELAAWCSAFIGGALLDAALRFVVRRSQLPFAEVAVANWTTGLASGHALGAVVGYAMLVHLIFDETQRAAWRTAVTLGAIVLVTGIAIGRLYLGTHYVSDETAGLAAGMVWALTCVSGIEIAKARRRSDVP